MTTLDHSKIPASIKYDHFEKIIDFPPSGEGESEADLSAHLSKVAVWLSGILKDLEECINIWFEQSVLSSGSNGCKEEEYQLGVEAIIHLLRKLEGSSKMTGIEQSWKQDFAKRLKLHGLSIPASLGEQESEEKTGPVLLSLAGPHGTDIFKALLDVCVLFGAKVEDFVFSRLRHQVTFTVQSILTEQMQKEGIYKELRKVALRWDATLTVESLSPHQLQLKEEKIGLEDAPYPDRLKFMATVLTTTRLQARFLATLSEFLLKEGISLERIHRLSSSSVDLKLSVPGTVNLDELRHGLFQLGRAYEIDIALQPYDVFRKHKRLVVFDMDSTLIKQEVIDELARVWGVEDQVQVVLQMDAKESSKRKSPIER